MQQEKEQKKSKIISELIKFEFFIINVMLIG